MPRSNNQYHILGVKIDNYTIGQSLDRIENAVVGKRKIYVVKPYVEFMTKAYSDKKIRTILNNSDISLADGVSLQWAASYLYGQKTVGLIRSLVKIIIDKKWLNEIIPERIGGINLTLPLLKLAEKKGFKVAIVGGPKDNQKTYKNITKIFPKLKLNGVWSGYFDQKNSKKIAKDIGKTKPDIVFVAMGFYRQELFISDYLTLLNCYAAIGEGGSFDFSELGGNLKRAPKFMQKLGLEWLWRLFLQPLRIKRQLAIPRFIYLVNKQHKKRN